MTPGESARVQLKIRRLHGLTSSSLVSGTTRDHYVIGGFDSFGFGFHDWHPQSAFDLYDDDVVLDVKRVNCLH